MDTNTRYCVFWFPTIFHCEKKNRIKGNSVGPYDIDDKSEEKKLSLEITREEQKSTNPNSKDWYDLIFKLSDKEGNYFDTRFKCVNQSRNGFVIYSYDREKLINDYYTIIAKDSDDSDSDKNDNIDTLFISFYHYAKLFYHEHESDNECDGKYASYFYTQETPKGPKKYLSEVPPLSTKNNSVINWYIDQFEKQIVSNAEDISQKLRDWTPQIEKYFKTKSIVNTALLGNDENDVEKAAKVLQALIGERPSGIPQNRNTTSIQGKKNYLKTLYQSRISDLTQNYIEDLTVFLSLCNNSLIEYTYCKTLLESKYNDNYKHDSEISADELKKRPNAEIDERDRCRKKAFNIRNSIRYIEDAKRKCEIWQNKITETLLDELHEISTKNTTLTEQIGKSNKISSRLGWWSFALGIISLGIALFFGIKGSTSQCNCTLCSSHSLARDYEDSTEISPTSIEMPLDTIAADKKVSPLQTAVTGK